MSEFQKRYEDYLMHYGIKGMKWGETNIKELAMKKGAVKPSTAYILSKGSRKHHVAGTANPNVNRRGDGIGSLMPVGGKANVRKNSSGKVRDTANGMLQLDDTINNHRFKNLQRMNDKAQAGKNAKYDKQKLYDQALELAKKGLWADKRDPEDAQLTSNEGQNLVARLLQNAEKFKADADREYENNVKSRITRAKAKNILEGRLRQ